MSADTTDLARRDETMKARIMYIECKEGGLSNNGKIRKVTFSKSGKSIHCGGLKLKSLKGRGFKANYFDETTGFEYWVSGPKKDGSDCLYSGHKISIDQDVAGEYWITIRNQPESKDKLWFKSPGKYSKHSPS